MMRYLLASFFPKCLKPISFNIFIYDFIFDISVPWNCQWKKIILLRLLLFFVFFNFFCFFVVRYSLKTCIQICVFLFLFSLLIFNLMILLILFKHFNPRHRLNFPLQLIILLFLRLSIKMFQMNLLRTQCNQFWFRIMTLR